MSTSSHNSNNTSPSPIINESNQRRCAACKYLRRRCSRDCQLPVHQRAQAAEAMSAEAYWRVQDPVYGSVGVINLLQQHIYMNQRELARTRAQIAIHPAEQEAHVAYGPAHEPAQFERSAPQDN
ncbi:LOB domain-containing protein 24, partial [Ananas comosus]